MKDRTFACLDRIKDWKLKPDTSKFPWSKYIKHAGDDTDGSDCEDGDDDKPLPPATKRTNETAATKTTARLRLQLRPAKAKARARAKRFPRRSLSTPTLTRMTMEWITATEMTTTSHHQQRALAANPLLPEPPPARQVLQ